MCSQLVVFSVPRIYFIITSLCFVFAGMFMVLLSDLLGIAVDKKQTFVFVRITEFSCEKVTGH